MSSHQLANNEPSENSIEKISNPWKRVFSVLYTLQQSFSPSSPLSVLFITIQYVQIILMLVTFGSSDQYWEPSMLREIVREIAGVFVDPLDLARTNNNVLLYMLTAVIIILLFVFALFGVAMYYPIFSAEQQTTYMFSVLLHLFSSVLMIPNISISFCHRDRRIAEFCGL